MIGLPAHAEGQVTWPDESLRVSSVCNLAGPGKRISGPADGAAGFGRVRACCQPTSGFSGAVKSRSPRCFAARHSGSDDGAGAGMAGWKSSTRPVPARWFGKPEQPLAGTFQIGLEGQPGPAAQPLLQIGVTLSGLFDCRFFQESPHACSTSMGPANQFRFGSGGKLCGGDGVGPGSGGHQDAGASRHQCPAHRVLLRR